MNQEKYSKAQQNQRKKDECFTADGMMMLNDLVQKINFPFKLNCLHCRIQVEKGTDLLTMCVHSQECKKRAQAGQLDNNTGVTRAQMLTGIKTLYNKIKNLEQRNQAADEEIRGSQLILQEETIKETEQTVEYKEYFQILQQQMDLEDTIRTQINNGNEYQDRFFRYLQNGTIDKKREQEFLNKIKEKNIELLTKQYKQLYDRLKELWIILSMQYKQNMFQKISTDQELDKLFKYLYEKNHNLQERLRDYNKRAFKSYSIINKELFFDKLQDYLDKKKIEFPLYTQLIILFLTAASVQDLSVMTDTMVMDNVFMFQPLNYKKVYLKRYFKLSQASHQRLKTLLESLHEQGVNTSILTFGDTLDGIRKKFQQAQDQEESCLKFSDIKASAVFHYKNALNCEFYEKDEQLQQFLGHQHKYQALKYTLSQNFQW